MGKTIAQELFTIAEAQGGTAEGYPRTIAGAVDALTDALAGSDVDSGRTIAEAVAVMGEYIGGGAPAGDGKLFAMFMSKDDFDGCQWHIEQDGTTLAMTWEEVDGYGYGIAECKAAPFSIVANDGKLLDCTNGCPYMYCFADEETLRDQGNYQCEGRAIPEAETVKSCEMPLGWAAMVLFMDDVQIEDDK